MLVLAPEIKREPSVFIHAREPGDAIEPVLIRSPIVIGDRLPEMEAVAQRSTTNAHKPRIRGLEAVHRPTGWNTVRRLRLKITEHVVQDAQRLGVLVEH